MKTLGRFSIERELASGGMATVYLARDSSLDRRVALKVPHAHLWEKPETRQRFLAEARAAASLNHENIVSIFDIGEAEGSLFLAMEYVEGSDLAVFLEKQAPLPDLIAAEILRQILAGLADAHAAGLVHRDVKPQNLLLDPRGCIKIADFGLSRLARSLSLGVTGGFLGTPRYASPELAEGKPLTEKSDLFAAGLILHECLFGEPAFAAEDPHALLRQIATALPEPPRRKRSSVLPCLDDLHGALLAKDPELRPSAAAAGRDLGRCLSERSLPSGPELLEDFLRDPEESRRRLDAQLAAHWSRLAEAEEKSGNPARARRYRVYAGHAPGFPVPPALPGQRNGSRRKTAMAAGALALLFLITVMAALFRRGDSPESTAAAPSAGNPAAPPLSDAETIAAALPAAPEPPPVKPNPEPPSSSASRAKPASVSPGYLRVLTRPPDARVWVDGQEIGTTPLPLHSLPAGRRRVELRRADCDPWKGEVDLRPGDTLELRRELVRVVKRP